MRVSSDVGALQQAGIPLRRTVNEGDYLVSGSMHSTIRRNPYPLWWRSMEMPSPRPSSVIRKNLQLLNVVCSTGQPCAHIYRSELSIRH